MYFVDREKIEQTLIFLDRQLDAFQSQREWDTMLEQAALERLAHTMIEAVLDVGNSIIDGFIMRDPGSYDDIVDILLDEKVVEENLGASLKELVHLRKNLVQSYIDINHVEVADLFHKHQKELGSFSAAVRNYLKNELGPVSAFKA